MSKWICTSCGMEAAPSASRPSLDDRYAIGWCINCAPEPQPAPPNEKVGKVVTRRPSPPRTAQLVRADLWDPGILASRREAKANAKLLDDYMAGKLHKDDDAGRERARSLLARYAAEAEARRTA